MISNESVFNFVAFTFIGPTHVPLHHKLLFRIVNTSSAILDQVGTSYNRQFGVRAQVLCTVCLLHLSWTASNFVPLMFLQGPYFSEDVAMGKWGPHSHRHKLNMADLYSQHPSPFLCTHFRESRAGSRVT